jgi:hypothetical protein
MRTIKNELTPDFAFACFSCHRVVLDDTKEAFIGGPQLVLDGSVLAGVRGADSCNLIGLVRSKKSGRR